MCYNNKIKGSIEEILNDQIVIINDKNGEKTFINKNLLNKNILSNLKIGQVVTIDISLSIIKEETESRKTDIINMQNDLFQ